MFDEILDKLVDEKMDCKEYQEIADEMEDEEIKAMFNKIADDEHNHYLMLKEYMNRIINSESM